MADLSGSWLGTYWWNGEPTRFEATFLQGGAALSGSILDDNTLGDATVSGEVIDRAVHFTKRYMSPGLAVIHYSGQVSEQEDFIQGNWQIDNRHSGTWEARRVGDNLVLELQTRRSEQTPLVI